MLKRVLMSLWRHGPTEITTADLLHEIHATLPTLQKSLNTLRQRQCIISQTPTGLRLLSTGLPCWQDILEETAKEKKLRIGQHVKIFAKTASTNDIAWQFAGNNDADGLIILADEQTAGRGRLGHMWTAKPSQSILMSVLLKEREGFDVERLTLQAGLAAAKAIEQSTKLHIQIKWPNDLLINNRKLGGVLIEKRQNNIVIGIGVNVIQSPADFPPDIAKRAASIYQETGTQMDRLRLIADLMQHLNDLCTRTIPDEHWLSEWKSRCKMFATRITAIHAGRRITGEVVDVDPLKGLVIRTETGSMLFLSSQTTTLGMTKFEFRHSPPVCCR
ncbi:MAG: biotin--[acetyl-CoA-carboxylase] ligase [Phycisphaerales bacterium]|nr:biotin--[acetyl-CoA-carboxylase] ligase [Phycisphaerales bacterium]